MSFAYRRWSFVLCRCAPCKYVLLYFIYFFFVASVFVLVQNFFGYTDIQFRRAEQWQLLKPAD